MASSDWPADLPPATSYQSLAATCNLILVRVATTWQAVIGQPSPRVSKWDPPGTSSSDVSSFEGIRCVLARRLLCGQVRITVVNTKWKQTMLSEALGGVLRITSVMKVKEFNDFLALYPVPSEYHDILPKFNQTVFNAPPGSEKHILNLLPKVITRIEGWHERFFYVQDSIIPAKYPQLLSEQNKLDLKSFKDKLPLNIKENPMFQHLSRYPTSVHVFPDPILFLAGLKPSYEHDMDFRNFIYIEDDDDLTFLPKEPSLGFGTGSLSVLVNTEPLKANEELDIQPVEVIADFGGSTKPGTSTSRATRAKTSSSKDDAPFLTVSKDDEGLYDVLELKYANAFHLKISDITLSAWKNHLDNHIDLELLDLHDRCYAKHVVVDNAVNKRSRELLQVIEYLRCKCDVMRSRERVRDEECKGLRVKCEDAMIDFEKNPAMVTALETEKARLEAVEVSFRKEVKELKQDRREVVSKVVPYATIELVHSDDMGSLVGKLVSYVIVYGRCRAFEQVAGMKEPFDLSKVKGYCSSYKKDHTQASNDPAIATFPWLDEFVVDPSAPIEALLSKKPPTLQRPAYSRTQVPLFSSQRDTSSSVPASNLMSPPADAFVVTPQSSPP
ncbi:hypothetical protein Tco_0832987 [Tanacetum coccineum]